MEKENQNNETPSTNISKHKKEGKTLLAPFRQIPNMRPSSWKDLEFYSEVQYPLAILDSVLKELLGR